MAVGNVALLSQVAAPAGTAVAELISASLAQSRNANWLRAVARRVAHSNMKRLDGNQSKIADVRLGIGLRAAQARVEAWDGGPPMYVTLAGLRQPRGKR